jgi:type I restriction enzyme S subunit
MDGEFNRARWQGEAAALNQRVCRIRPLKNRIDDGYLYHLLPQELKRIEDRTPFVTVKHLSVKQINAAQILLPPLPEQRRIAAILDQADALRAKRREALAKLDEMAQAIFVEMFDGQNSGKQIRLDEFVEVLVGYPFQSSGYTESESAVRLCRGANVLPNAIDWSDTVRWPEQDAGRFSDFLLREDDIVIAMDRPWISSGFKVALISISDTPSLLVQRVARLRAANRAQSLFLYYLVKRSEFEQHCRTTETTVPHISPKDIKSFRFYLPLSDTQRRFGERVQEIWRQRELVSKCFDLENALFTSLQQRAFAGTL